MSMIKLQNLLLPRPGICDQKKMYYRRCKNAEPEKEGSAIVFRRRGHAEFDTYFNSFSVEKWKKYTEVKQVFLTLKLQGEFEITLLNKEKIHDTISCREHSATRFSAAEPQEVTIPYIPYEDKGQYSFALTALSDGSRFLGGYYGTEADGLPLNDVNLALNICTFRREAFIQRNLRILSRDILDHPENELSEHLHVFISDNGHTLDIPALANEKVHIVRNKNVGGAGGFTRNLIEVMHCKTYKATHNLFMDDDVVIEPEALYRTYMLLRCMKENYRDIFIGGAMLRLDKPNIQVEAGAAWNAGDLLPLKRDLDLNTREAVLYNETEEYTEYNAWWYCCIPMTVVTPENLPLPIFIRGDDLEYGLRNMKHLLLLNGICVWHEPFENKYSSFLNYYILRNLMYDNALHVKNFSRKMLYKQMLFRVKHEILCERYKNVDLLFRGIDDFFKGVDFLKNTDGEALHKEIMAAGYKAQPLEELDMPFSYPAYEHSLHENDGGLKKKIRQAGFNGLFYPANRETVVSMALCKPISFYRAKRTLQYDVTSKKGFITVRSARQALKCNFRTLGMIMKIRFKFDKAVKEFRERAPELMTEENWKKYLDLD